MSPDPGLAHAIDLAILVAAFGVLVWIAHVLDCERKGR
jgi:hypothetical protein